MYHPCTCSRKRGCLVYYSSREVARVCSHVYNVCSAHYRIRRHAYTRGENSRAWPSVKAGCTPDISIRLGHDLPAMCLDNSTAYFRFDNRPLPRAQRDFGLRVKATTKDCYKTTKRIITRPNLLKFNYGHSWNEIFLSLSIFLVQSDLL